MAAVSSSYQKSNAHNNSLGTKDTKEVTFQGNNEEVDNTVDTKEEYVPNEVSVADDDLKTDDNTPSKSDVNQSKEIQVTIIEAMDLHNELLFADQKQYVDIRPTKEYNESRILRFINIPLHSKEEFVIQQLSDCADHIWSYESNVLDSIRKNKLWVVSNQEMMDNGSDIEWYQYLASLLLQIKSKDDWFKQNFRGLNVLNTDFTTFAKDHSYLIRSDDPDHDDQVTLQYPNIIVKDKLYLGDSDDAQDREFITRFKITHILNVTIMCENTFEDDEELDIEYLKKEVMDSHDANLAEHFDICIGFINAALNANDGDNDHRVLVHCFAGVSRSSSVVIAWLMKNKNMEFEDAMRFVEDKRAIIAPNMGFRKQLRAWKKSGFKVAKH